MGKLQINGDLLLAAGDEDRFLTFNYTGGTGYDWRIGYLGSDSGNENFLVFQSDKEGSTFYNALKFGLTTLNAEFGGTVTASSFIGNLSGNASSATKLQTARTIRTNLASTSTASFNGTANIAPGVTGILPIANGGTGANTKADAAYNLLSYTTKNGDFNTYTAMGHYWTQLASCTNTPFGDNPTEERFGFLEVIAPWEEGSTPLQRWTNYYDGDTWVRSAINAWNPWVRYLTSNNYSNYCLPATGGTLTGLTSISYAHTGGGMLQLSSTDNNESSIGYNSGGTQYWVVGKGCGGTGNGIFAWWYNPSGKNMMTLNNSGNLHLAGNTISFSGGMTENTSPTVVATYINNNSANGLGFAYTSNLSVGQASYLTNINSTDMASSSSVKRYIWMSYADLVTGRPAYDTNLTFQTSSGTLFTPKLNVGGKVELWTDGEGGNIRITSPNGSWWSIDALSNNVLRFIWAEAQVPFTFSSEGFFTSIRSDMGCLRLTNNEWTGYGYEDPWDAGLTGVEGRVYFKLHR